MKTRNSKWLTYIIVILSVSFYQESAGQEFIIDINAQRNSFFDFIEHVEVIPLEETKKSLLSRIEFYFETPLGIGIIENPKKSLVQFDTNGRYLNSIYRFGEGPDEYQNISTVWVEENLINVYSGKSRSVIKFNLEGEYLQTSQVDYPKEILGGSLAKYRDGYVVKILDRARNRVNNHLMFLDKNFKLKTYAAARLNPHPFPVNLSNRFSFLNDDLIWKKQLSDSIFLIDEYKAEPFMRFNFGDDWAWNDPIASSSHKTAFNTIWREDSKVWEVISKVGKRYVLLAYHFKILENGKGIIDRETGKFYRFDMRKKNQEDFDLFLLQWEGDRLVSSLQAYDVEEFLENMDKSQYSIAGGMSYEDFKDSENSVILKIKFKIPN